MRHRHPVLRWLSRSLKILWIGISTCGLGWVWIGFYVYLTLQERGRQRRRQWVNHRAVLPQIPTWMNQKGGQSGDSFPATGPVYGTVATDPPSRKGSQIRKL